MLAFLPPVDITASPGDLVITMDLPGVPAGELDIELVDSSLVVRGRRVRPQLNGDATWTHTERAFGDFERRVKLPHGVDPDAITASFENGVLSLIVPKPERMKPRRISIAGAAPERNELAGAAA